MRGEFRFQNGLVIPNNVTSFGAQTVLDLAFRAADTSLFVGLCSAVYTPDLQIESITEPTIGTNGYSRVQLNRDSTDWPTLAALNGSQYVESRDIAFLAVGGAFDKPISRMFLCDSADAVSGDLFCLSAALPAEITIDVDTDAADRTFKYRFYGR